MNIYGAIIAVIAAANGGANINSGPKHKRQKTRSQFFYLDPKFQGSATFYPQSTRFDTAFKIARMRNLTKKIRRIKIEK